MLVLRDTAKAEASASGEDKKALRRQNRVSSALATVDEPDEGRKKKRTVPVRPLNCFALITRSFDRLIHPPCAFIPGLLVSSDLIPSYSLLKKSASKRAAQK
jgi:hypothetical protein